MHSMTSMYIALATGIVVWWFVVRKLTAKPWVAGDVPADMASPLLKLPPQRVGLVVFLAMVSSLFAIFITAYWMRAHHGHWSHMALPVVLWANTAMLVLASVALHMARRAVAQDKRSTVVNATAITGLLSVGFLAGQYVAWMDIAASGHYMTGSPTTAFFYVLTTVHGLHVLGGLWAWARTARKLWRGAELDSVRLSIELCSVYWHYLLLVWLVLFAVLALT